LVFCRAEKQKGKFMLHSQLVVLGGGPGGYAAAFLAADLGMDVALVESSLRLGGTCLLRGCIPSKALLHATGILSQAAEAEDWGVTFGRPKIDLDKLRTRKDKVIDTLSGGLGQLAKKRNVRVIRARGAFVDSTTLRLEGGDPATYAESDRLTFENCILATGSAPVMPASLHLPTPRIMNSTGALALADVPERMLVIGGGYIGLEMASVYAKLGCGITVVEMMPNLLSGADADLVRPLHKRLEGLLDKIYLSTKVAAMKDLGEQIEVTFEGEAAGGAETFDRVLVSIGRRPRSARLGIENTKVELDDAGFVKVDARQQTADPHIRAIGDVAGQPMLAHKAAYEAKIAVEALHGDAAALADARAIPAVVFTDPEIAWTGPTEAEAKARGLNVEVSKYPWTASGRAHALGQTDGLTKLLINRDSEQVLGAGIVGAGAGELIAEATLAIEMGAVAEDLARTIHAHPTMAETIHFAAEAFYGTATEIYKPKKK
jgi:dihydrolipoamide dehydrogenase